MSVTVLQVLGMSAGGIATHVAQVARSLREDPRFEVAIAAPPNVPVPMGDGTIPVTIPDGPLGHRRAVRDIETIIRDIGADVVHAHGLRAGIDAARAGRKVGVPVVTTVHNLVQPEIAGRLKARLYRLAEPLVVRLSDLTLAVSHDIARSLPDDKGRVEVLHLGIGDAPEIRRNADDIRSEVGVPDGHPLVVAVARLAPQKALHVMLEALATVDRAHLAILGDGPLGPRLREQAHTLGLGDRVHFLGFRQDVPDHVAAADTFCLSSIWEGVPLSAQEAILLGTPIVATDVGGMDELVTDGTSGWLVPRDDPGALAAALAEALADPARARERAERARADLTVEFSTTKMLDRLTQIYEELADARQGPRPCRRGWTHRHRPRRGTRASAVRLRTSRRLHAPRGHMGRHRRGTPAVVHVAHGPGRGRVDVGTHQLLPDDLRVRLRHDRCRRPSRWGEGLGRRCGRRSGRRTLPA